MAGPGKGTLEELVEAYYSALYRYAFRLSGVGPEAEDLTQETFCQAQVKLAQLRDWARARNWLFAILRNLYLHRLRAAKKENVVPLDGLGEVAELITERKLLVQGLVILLVVLLLPQGLGGIRLPRLAPWRTQARAEPPAAAKEVPHG